ncbi:outer membrane protein assembly factor [Aquiflexum gelatinilyticum]|uniref:Outer membrane protein assembly factor n=1 Tax=Aquiflexum gelatinilyticum TaxID=2961943 RepID=A0A9X2P2L0_9BACT|nr:outer membrane protein assembly factor [Aquiflexum gelatinilyticum]MCR9014814.1 outer membrane protein assembly factor [Aquiflexum gelatinilyticum]
MSKQPSIILSIFLLLSFSCGVKKFIPEGQRLYTGHVLNLEAPLTKSERSNLQSDLDNLVKPEPNAKILGTRFGLWAHYKSSKEKPGFINRFLGKRFGEKPVYLSDVQPERTTGILINRLENMGYFFGEPKYELIENGKFVRIEYTLSFGEPYRLETYQLLGDSLEVIQEIKTSLDKTDLVKGSKLDLDNLKKERERIDLELKSKGYYNFNGDLLIFEADTNQYEDRRFDLYLRLKGNTPVKSKFPYTIQDIKVFPNYAINEDITDPDTVNINGIDIIQSELVFKPDLLANYILFREGSKFDPQISRQTSNRLSSIGNFRYVNISFEEADSIRGEDGNYPLNARILLSPLNQRSVRAEVQGVTKSNSFVGPALQLNFQNRNLFKGGEIFNLTAKFGYEVQLQSGDRQAQQSIEFGLQGSLVFPRVLFPVPVMNRFKFAIPKTRITAGVEYQNRTDLYLLNSYNTSFGYFWNINKYTYHEFNPISASIVNLIRTTPEFDEILESNPFLRRSFEQQFILGMNYTFNYNQLVDTHRKNAIFFSTTIDLAGNFLKGINTLLDTENPGFVFGLEYAQFVKNEMDIRFYHKFSKESMIVTRLYGGVGVPLGNSVSLPFVKQFFSGGPRSVRAFRIRSLGPGIFLPEDASTSGFFDQAGDIRLEGNVELRFPLNKYLKGAVFTDAGNIWLFNENDALPGGKFSRNWAKELGVGAGFGLRIDINLFVLRFDLAFPVRKPWLPENDRWLDTFNVLDAAWRRENMVLNFAIGYPF